MGVLLGVKDRLRARTARRDAPTLRALLDAGPNTRVLDIGGGTGAVAELVAPRSIVFVLEPDPRKIAHGHYERPRFGFVEGGAERLPFPDHSFDRAMMLLSFHHIPRQAQALREVRRVLVPGGRLVMQELSPSEGVGKWVAALERTVMRQDVSFHEPAALAEMLEQSGFAALVVRPASKGYFVAASRPGVEPATGESAGGTRPGQ